MLSLPPEICALIISKVELPDLASLVRTSHAMLDRFVPYLWRNVEAEWLFALLPGADFAHGRFGACQGQIDAPISPPADYFDRFYFYARHVNIITVAIEWMYGRNTIYNHTPAWLSILSDNSARTVFPKLQILVIGLLNGPSQAILDWANLFIVSTLIDIRFNVPTDVDEEIPTRVLDTILSKCLGLERMLLLMNGVNSTWDRFACSTISQSLKSLKVLQGTVGVPFMNWIGKMPYLEELELRPYSWGSNRATTISSYEFPPESFMALLSLEIVRGDKNHLARLCRTPVVTHLTKLVARVYTSRKDDIATGKLLALVAARSPNLQEIEFDGQFYLEKSDIAVLHPLSLRSFRFTGSNEAGPELCMSTFSGLAPTLEVLELNNCVSLGSIMILPLHLPRLEVLSICIDQHGIPDVVDTSHLNGASLDETRVIWLSHSFTLVLRSDQWEELEPEKLDMFSKILAMTWPDMNLHFRGSDESGNPVFKADLIKIKKKVDDYSKLVLQNGSLI
ncbi:hypothetical protein BDV93DRAFT_607484 [Ceratobasidium sp. AG-I]|nr:hypothetical protein BDV93DRAFT_607484 [Ceratobasidium sp. AG-I]